MTLPRRAASLLTGLLLLAAGAHAQTQPGQPTLDEQKVQIWCATAKFVYDDTGRPNLKSKLRCGGTLKEFVNSIKADSQKVYSLLYLPLEGKGAMYKGLGSDKARLQKLEKEIISRLSASAPRRKDPARMRQVAALDAALQGYLTNGTPPGDLSAGAAPADASDTTPATDEATAAAPADAGPAAMAASGNVPVRTVGDSLMNRLFGPLGLILSLLSLALYVFLRRTIGGLEKRVARHRGEIDSVRNTALTSSAPSAAVLNRLTPELQREIERVVQQRVAEELSKLPKPTVAPSAPVTSVPVLPGPTPPAPMASAPVLPVPPAPAAPAPPIHQAPAELVTFYEAPAPLTEVAPPIAVVPTGSPATANRDDFDSLVAAVHLPTPEPSPTATSEDVGATFYTRYVKVPVNGGFSEYDLSEEPQHDSIYELILDSQFPDVGIFQVNPNPAVHAYAIQSAQYSLREACRYQQPSEPVTRIVTDEEGTLRRIGGVWHIESKADIHFE